MILPFLEKYYYLCSMKGVLKNISIIVLAVYFLAAGIGYNIVKYCCSVCETAKIELCHEETDDHDCCGGLAHENKGNHHHSDDHQCALVYFKADFPAIEKTQSPKFEPKQLDLPIILVQDFSSITSYQTQKYIPPQKQFLRGRDILSKICILII